MDLNTGIQKVVGLIFWLLDLVLKHFVEIILIWFFIWLIVNRKTIALFYKKTYDSFMNPPEPKQENKEDNTLKDAKGVSNGK